MRRSSWILHQRWWKSSSQKLNLVLFFYFVNNKNTKTCLSRVAWDTWNPVWISEDHLVRLNTPRWPIVHKYREGMVKRTPVGEWNRTWNPTLTNSGRRFNADRVPVEEWAGDLEDVARLRSDIRSQSESKSEKGEYKSRVLDPNPGDLTMTRMKLG